MTEVENKILINVEDDETRIALLNGKNLENLYIEQTDRTQKVGNIYCGKVVKIQPSFQAAFIDFGEERHGFLSISDINFQVYKSTREGRGRSSISQVLKIGQKILVQVIKDEIAHKGASLTTNISIAGRFLVFMPDSDRGGVSKKIEDEEQRNRLRHLLKGLGSENSSAIIRTVGVDRSLTELKRDYTILRRTWIEIKNDYDSESSTKLIYKEEDAMLRMIRDYYNDDVTEVLIDEPVSFQNVLEFFKTYLPNEQKKLKLYLGEKSIFSSHDIENQIEILEHQEVPLPSGGSLVIIPTEALVAIDVNSGRSAQEKNIEATALRTNLEAAEEISRQLRLRNLGGLIVIDFIDMEVEKNRILVEQKIEESMSFDKAKTSFGIISKFGLLELSRQRISSSLLNNSNIITLANRILRKIHDVAITEKLLQVQISLSLELSSHILNNKRRRLNQMEMDYGVRIYISPDTLLNHQEIPEMEITIQEQGSIENKKTIPISSLGIKEEKRSPKKNKIKKVDNKKTTAHETSIKSELPVKKEILQNVKNDKALKKSKTEKSKDDKNKNEEFHDLISSENTIKSKQETKDLKKEEQENKNKQENHEKLNEEKPGTIFMSTHVPVDLNNINKNNDSDNKSSLEKKNDNKLSFQSTHLEKQDNVKNYDNPNYNQIVENDLTKETALYSSVHLDEIKTMTKKHVINKRKNFKTPIKEKKIKIAENNKTKTNNSISKGKDPLTSKNKDKPKKKNIEKGIKTIEKSKKLKNKVEPQKDIVANSKKSKSLTHEKEEKIIQKSDTKLDGGKLKQKKSNSKKRSIKNSKTKNSTA